MLNEIPVTIDAGPDRMLGIVSQPDAATPMRPVGVVMVVGGAQYRVGSHRQCVSLARGLASEGFASLRFDLPGLGDSPGEPLAFEQTAAHIGAAIDQLIHRSTVQQVVLWGLCDGASASLLYAQARNDPRVIGLALLNPWIASDTALAKARIKHYYGQRVLTTDFWHKLLTGGVGWRAARELLGTWRRQQQPTPPSAAHPHRMALAWQGFGGHLLLMLSEHDLTAQTFEQHIRHDATWRGWDHRPRLTLQRLKGADHTCSTPLSQPAMARSLVAWLHGTSPP